MTNQCKGCLTYNTNPIHEMCLYKRQENKHCPCYECLVKGVCLNSCEIYSTINYSYRK